MSTIRVNLEPDEAAVLEVIAEEMGQRPEDTLRGLLRDEAVRFLGGQKKEPKLSKRDRTLKRLGVNIDGDNGN
jgi:DnaJ-domain-containing protein 1